MNKFSLFTAILLCTCIMQTYAQDSCKVLLREISGSYQGRCKNGLAQGKGIAAGIDKYEGNFRKGLPDGKGKYTWSNGETYNGSWKEGKKHGEGVYTYKKNGADSVLTGIWENDQFVRKITPPPYKIFILRDIDRYSITKTGEVNRISLQFMKMGMVNNDVTELSFEADNGSFKRYGSKYLYDQVIFPLTVRINYATTNKLGTAVIKPSLEVTFNEPGEWEIVLNN